MVVDSSVLLQILFNEAGAEEVVRTLGRVNLTMASPTLLETEVVYGSRRGFNSGEVAELIRRLGISVEPFTAEHALEAKLAYARFGKGQAHPARLNFGDCVSYALAKITGQPLAFKGEDFNLTDLRVVKLG